MGTSTARRARRRAYDVLAYRAWAADPSQAAIPAMSVLTDPSIHRFERERELRLAQNGRFESPARAGLASTTAA